MRERPIQYYLAKLEEYRSEDLHLSKPAMANELGIPFGTYRNWYRETETRTNPSSKYHKWIKRFLEARHIISANRWIEQDGPDLLHRIGVSRGQTVMDFGSGNGDYSLILRQVVGQEGKVYAIDKNKDVLAELMGRAYGEGFGNIEGIVAEGGETPTTIAVPDESIDAGWFSDVLHDGYFEEDEQKQELLRDVRRALKKHGFLAVHPVHMEKERLKRVIKGAGFHLEEEYQEVLLFHGSEFHEGQIFKYKKDRKYDT